MDFNNLEMLINFIINAHNNYSINNKDAFRRWDKKTPYYIHPIWCAMTLLTEENLPEELRIKGAKVLLLHDIIEDTKAELPSYISGAVKKLVSKMTFASLEGEKAKIFNKSSFVKLLKLYDKVSNLMDSGWMSTEKRKSYIEYTSLLLTSVENDFGELNIFSIAKTIITKNLEETRKEEIKNGKE